MTTATLNGQLCTTLQAETAAEYETLEQFAAAAGRAIARVPIKPALGGPAGAIVLRVKNKSSRPLGAYLAFGLALNRLHDHLKNAGKSQTLTLWTVVQGQSVGDRVKTRFSARPSRVSLMTWWISVIAVLSREPVAGGCAPVD